MRQKMYRGSSLPFFSFTLSPPPPLTPLPLLHPTSPSIPPLSHLSSLPHTSPISNEEACSAAIGEDGQVALTLQRERRRGGEERGEEEGREKERRRTERREKEEGREEEGREGEGGGEWTGQGGMCVLQDIPCTGFLLAVDCSVCRKK